MYRTTVEPAPEKGYACHDAGCLSVPEVNSEYVTILLGAIVLEAILQHDVQRGRPGQPVSILTAFGWTIAGSVKSVVKPERLHVMHVHRVLNADES